MRVIISLFLCLSLAATSVSAAVMHSEMQGMTEMTICSDAGGDGVITITFDATGKPIQGHHRCPECLASMSTAVMPAEVTLTPPQTCARSLHVAKLRAGTGRPSPAATARGPPVFA